MKGIVKKVPLQRTASPRQPEQALDRNDPGFVRRRANFQPVDAFEIKVGIFKSIPLRTKRATLLSGQADVPGAVTPVHGIHKGDILHAQARLQAHIAGARPGRSSTQRTAHRAGPALISPPFPITSPLGSRSKATRRWPGPCWAR